LPKKLKAKTKKFFSTKHQERKLFCIYLFPK
jgi:hypothetical protein